MDQTPTVPETMRAAVLVAPGEPLAVKRIRTPRPRSGEVLVKVTACGLCHSDLHVMSGKILFPTPAVLGHEVSGVLVELGENTLHSGLAVGDAVCGAFLMPCGQCPDCARGRDDLCAPFFRFNRLQGQLFDGSSRLADLDGSVIAQYSMGGLAEYCVIPVTAVTPMPEGMDAVAAAILGCAAMTAYGAVRRGADLRHGETVAVIGIGGVGSHIVQVAHELGARRVIAIDVDDDKLEHAIRYGASDVINSRHVNARTASSPSPGGGASTWPSRRWDSLRPSSRRSPCSRTEAGWCRSAWPPGRRPRRWRSTGWSAGASRSAAPTVPAREPTSRSS